MSHSSETNMMPAGSSGIGIEVADGGMRLVAQVARRVPLAHGATSTEKRWRHQLSAPPSPDEALAAINDLITRVLADGVAEHSDRPQSVGIAIWGDVDPVEGVTLGMPHAPGWEGFPFVNRLSNLCGLPVFLMSAVAAAGLAEARFGAGQGHRIVLYVHCGRTVTSAVIRDGNFVPGASGRAGKMGHMLVQPDGPRCACGIRGHLDPLASAQAIVRSTIGLASGSDEGTAAMLRISGGRAEAMTVRQVVRLASEGDPSARSVLETAWDALAVALANLVAVLDPAIIVIGGPPAEAGEAFREPIHQRLIQLCDLWRPTPDIVSATLEPHAALHGACLLADNRKQIW